MHITDYRFFHEITALPFVDAVYLFGSRARGEADDWSDIDLAIACPNATAQQWQDLRAMLARVEEILVPVHVTRYDGAYDGPLRAHINTHMQVLFERHG
jgi:predicted nucleotidyltransferase